MSDSAPPPRCGFGSWFNPSPTLSSSRPHYRVYPQVAAVESEVTDRAAALQTFVGGVVSQGPPLCGCRSAAFCGPTTCESVVFPSCGHCGHGVQALGLRHVCRDGAAGEVIPESVGGDVFVPLDDVWNPRHVEAQWLQPLHSRLVQHGHFVRICLPCFSSSYGGLGVGVPSC